MISILRYLRKECDLSSFFLILDVFFLLFLKVTKQRSLEMRTWPNFKLATFSPRCVVHFSQGPCSRC